MSLDVDRHPSRSRSLARLTVFVGTLLVLLAVGVSYTSRGEGALPRARASSADDPVAENLSCEHCHVEIAAEWRRSQHHSSYTDEAFQRALEVEPKSFCRNCHAPEDPEGERGEAERTLGVACVTCHLAGHDVIAAPKEFSWPPPHRVDRQAAFASASACAGCHAFSFGDDDRRLEPLPMQNTIEEHRRSDHADKSCAECHMPRGKDGRRSHAFASTRDDESHRRTLTVTAEREKNLVHLRLVNEAGHAYPTGDLFRRVTVEAEAADEEHRVRGSAHRFLGRHFDIGRDLLGAPIRVEARDDRIIDESRITLDLGDGAGGLPITWSVTLDRVLHVANHRESEAVVESRVMLASGKLDP